MFDSGIHLSGTTTQEVEEYSCQVVGGTLHIGLESMHKFVIIPDVPIETRQKACRHTHTHCPSIGRSLSIDCQVVSWLLRAALSLICSSIDFGDGSEAIYDETVVIFFF